LGVGLISPWEKNVRKTEKTTAGRTVLRQDDKNTDSWLKLLKKKTGFRQDCRGDDDDDDDERDQDVKVTHSPSSGVEVYKRGSVPPLPHTSP
jgi:hypothetical protein